MKGNILLVEDDDDCARLVAAFLKNEPGVGLTHVRSGHQAILELKQKEFDLVLLDINMAEMDGFTVLDLLRHYQFEDLAVDVPPGLSEENRQDFIKRSIERKNEKLRRLPVVMLTASSDPEDRTRAGEYRISGYLVKPVTRETLVPTLELLI